MSGFAGIVNFDGEPVDRDLLDRMASRLTMRGPDEQRVWVGGWNQNVGLVHTKFATTFEGERESQPLTLDGQRWITGHIRVDAREELWDKLEGSGCRGVRQATDAELVLHAYAIWGERCAEHLLGEFAFSVWDQDKRACYCWRDRLGVRELFYSRFGQSLVFGNALDVVRLHPKVSAQVDDTFVMDFLLFDASTEAGRTVCEGVRRLGPAHLLRAAEGLLEERRYWELPIREPLHLKREEEYCERFRELVQNAVKDRIRTRRIGVFLSGGLDSPTMAAAATRVMPEGAAGVKGYCVVVDRLIPDDERYFSGLVAKRLGISIRYRVLDDEIGSRQWPDEIPRTPEPVPDILGLRPEAEYTRQIARENRVYFHGEGPDNGLQYEWKAYLKWLWGQGMWGRILKQTASHVRWHGSIPLWRAVAAAIPGAGKREDADRQELPAWINENTAKKCGMEERGARYWVWEDLRHPVRPKAYYSFTSGLFAVMFGDWESVNEFAPLEVRHPLSDVRLVEFLLSVPVIPWARRKSLVRRAMAGELPRECLTRNKTPVQGDFWYEVMREVPYPAVRLAAELEPYVDVRRLPSGPPSSELEMRNALRVYGLDAWLRQSRHIIR